MQVTCRKSVKTQGTAAAKPPSGVAEPGLSGSSMAVLWAWRTHGRWVQGTRLDTQHDRNP
jgi:hypothetical protein